MSETQNTARQAELLATILFEEFFWSKLGPTNHDWPCEIPEHHKVTTHPCDVVYFYDEPYSVHRTYINCDLKSYAKGSISNAAVKTAVESLAKQVACAERSEFWRELHTHEDVSFNVVGLLFVYNHDGEYDADFQATLNDIDPASLEIPKGSRLFVLGPREIFWLDNVRDEIARLRGRRNPELPSAEYCSFHHPQLIRHANLNVTTAKAATLEMITSPVIMLEYRDPKGSARKGIIVFYSRPGESAVEFMYLIDSLRKFDFLNSDTSVTIKTLGASPVSSPMFEKAQQEYIENLSGSNWTDLSSFVRNIKYEPMLQIKTTYSNIDIGTWDV